ncbi:hypothetical protein MAMC_00930 [Methylacidimicrobium cyclopophantes]|uniref:Uncharacterized protein n=1 Tax=Methylacidimicrobium cyclopophantes TaxID=1041766 RepID=A0A5E6MAN1_9BACT|nr:hypothetical protein [Methylacidimicrobium cyclopophantes]VVM06029.1 hypothetical protein MAMC_00930 [Methylacidimicrobium cyclopophantes]
MRKVWLLLWLGVFGLSAGGFAEEVRRAYETEPGGEYLALDPRVKIVKVWNFLNVPTKKVKSSPPPALMFEKMYWNWGAITPEDAAMRQGDIYVFHWRNRGKPRDLLARFEYRQTKTREAVWSQVDFSRRAHGNVHSLFLVVGDDYTQHGRVYAWRFTVIDGNRILAQAKSFIW